MLEASDTSAPEGASIFSGYLDRAELAKGLRKTVRSIDRMVLAGDGPPYVQVGNKKLFRREAVLKWLREREKPCRPSRRGAR